MKLILEDNQKNVIKKSLNVLTEFGRVNFKPYLDALNQLVEMPLNTKTNVEFLILTAQNKMLNAIDGPNIEMTENMVNALSAFKKVEKGEFEFTDRESVAVSVATENFARLGMAQTGYVRDLLMIAFPKIETKDFCKVAECFDLAEKHIGATNGIRAERTAEDSQIAWDIHQVMRNYNSWKRNPEGKITVDYDTPRQTSKFPLPKIEGYNPKSEMERSQILSKKHNRSRSNKPF